jgi:hypothetical protein
MSGHQDGLQIDKGFLPYKEPFPCPICSHTELLLEFHPPSVEYHTIFWHPIPSHTFSIQEVDQYDQLCLGIKPSSQGYWDWFYPGFEPQNPYTCSPDDDSTRGKDQSTDYEVQSMQFAEGPWDPLSVAFDNSFTLSTSSYNIGQIPLDARTEGVKNLLDQYLHVPIDSPDVSPFCLLHESLGHELRDRIELLKAQPHFSAEIQTISIPHAKLREESFCGLAPDCGFIPHSSVAYPPGCQSYKDEYGNNTYPALCTHSPIESSKALLIGDLQFVDPLGETFTVPFYVDKETRSNAGTSGATNLTVKRPEVKRGRSYQLIPKP